jgi:hypothetical protein
MVPAVQPSHRVLQALYAFVSFQYPVGVVLASLQEFVFSIIKKPVLQAEQLSAVPEVQPSQEGSHAL